MTAAVSVLGAKVEACNDDSPAAAPIQTNEHVVTVNPLLNEFVDCIDTLPSRLQLLLTEIRNIDAQVNFRHRKIQLIRQEILSKTIVRRDGAPTTTTRSDGDNSNASSDYSDDKVHMEQLLTKLHQLLLQCQLLGDQKVKLTGQIMEILSNKTRRLGLDTKSNEERNFHVELDEEKILNEFKVAIKKRSMHYHNKSKHQNLTPSANAVSPAAASSTNSPSTGRSSRQQCNAHNLQTGSSKSKQQHLNSAEINKAVAKYTKTSTPSSSSKYFSFTSCNNDAYSYEDIDRSNRVELESKSLRNLNLNLINGKKPIKKSNFNSSTSSSGYLSKKNTKSKLQQQQIAQQSLNHRPKRQLNYTSTTNLMTSSKKPRISQLKQKKTQISNSLSLADNTPASVCNSPSSSSTSSHHHHRSSKLKATRAANSSKSDRLNRLRQKPTLKKEQQPPKGRKSKKSLGRRAENHDDADDDLSDDIDESKDNFNDTDNSDYETHQQQRSQQEIIAKVFDNDEDLNSNETESINELDNSKNGNSEHDDEINENNESNLSENDDETDEDYHKNINKRTFTYNTNNNNRNYESHNDENSENDSTIANKPYHKLKPKTKLKSAAAMAAKNAAAAAQAAAETDLAEQEPIYCVCNEISYGNMICCDNNACSIEWFHFQCVNLVNKPKGKWYCPNCRGDSHKSMRKLT